MICVPPVEERERECVLSLLLSLLLSLSRPGQGSRVADLRSCLLASVGASPNPTGPGSCTSSPLGFVPCTTFRSFHASFWVSDWIGLATDQGGLSPDPAVVCHISTHPPQYKGIAFSKLREVAHGKISDSSEIRDLPRPSLSRGALAPPASDSSRSVSVAPRGRAVHRRPLAPSSLTTRSFSAGFFLSWILWVTAGMQAHTNGPRGTRTRRAPFVASWPPVFFSLCLAGDSTHSTTTTTTTAAHPTQQGVEREMMMRIG